MLMIKYQKQLIVIVLEAEFVAVGFILTSTTGFGLPSISEDKSTVVFDMLLHDVTPGTRYCISFVTFDNTFVEVSNVGVEVMTRRGYNTITRGSDAVKNL